jgi:hypothetical protein
MMNEMLESEEVDEEDYAAAEAAYESTCRGVMSMIAGNGVDSLAVCHTTARQRFI